MANYFDTFAGAKSRFSNRGKKAPLSINPEHTPGFRPPSFASRMRTAKPGEPNGLILASEAGLIASFQEGTVISMMLARFLMLFSRHGGSLSSPTSEEDRPLRGTLPLFRQVPD